MRRAAWQGCPEVNELVQIAASTAPGAGDTGRDCGTGLGATLIWPCSTAGFIMLFLTCSVGPLFQAFEISWPSATVHGKLQVEVGG